jgi:hypothetical protein
MFQIHALPRAAFADLFALDDVALAARGAVRRIADATGGFPCRISLIDAAPGEELILANYEHQDAASPFRASHAVYVRVAAEEAHPAPGEVPSQLRTRMLSLRAFDAAGMMLDFELIDGRAIETGIARLLADPATTYLHAHFAGPGCYAARIDRG